MADREPDHGEHSLHWSHWATADLEHLVRSLEALEGAYLPSTLATIRTELDRRSSKPAEGAQPSG
jgi:hypothetical protein